MTSGVGASLREHRLEVDGDLAGARVEGLLRVAALLEEVIHGASGERRGGDPGPGEDDLREHGVEVVPAEAPDARGGEDLVTEAAHADDGRVERAAAQIVDDDEIALRRERVAVAVRVLEAGRRRLVEHRHDVEAGAAEGVHRDEALGAVRVGGDGDGGAEHGSLGEGAANVGALAQCAAHVLEEAGDHVGDEDVGAADARALPGARVHAREEPLERAHHGERGIVGDRGRVEAVKELAALLGDERRDPLRRVAGRVGEADDGVVPTVGAGDHRARGAEVDAQVHGGMLPRLRSPGACFASSSGPRRGAARAASPAGRRRRRSPRSPR